MAGIPERIGKYRILGSIGRGGMGTVYKAHDPLLDRLVAIKVMTEEAAAGIEARLRFLREAQSAARLNHPNIITVYELGEDGGQVFIVMELLEGEPLSRLVASVPPLPLRDRLALMLQICDGLAFAHRRGVVHRDIKPGNIFVLENRQVKILDFGIARLSTSDLTRTGLLMGTPNYMSPEQARGQRTDVRSDIFSVGVVFYELLSGRKPFAGVDYFETLERVRTADPPPLGELASPLLPGALVAAVERALAKDPAERYQTLDDLRAALGAVRDGLESEGTRDLRDAVRRKFAEVVRLHRMLVASVGAAALGDEAPPIADLSAEGPGLGTLLRDLEEQAERLNAVARRVERLEPVVERGIAAFERGGYAEAVAALDAVLAEIPQHKRARDYRDRARLEAMQERTVQSLGPADGVRDTPPGRLAVEAAGGSGGSAEVAGAAGQPGVAASVATPPPYDPVADEPAGSEEITGAVASRRSRLALAGTAALAITAGGAYLFFLAPAPAPRQAPPAARPAGVEVPGGPGAGSPPGTVAPQPPEARPAPPPPTPPARAATPAEARPAKRPPTPTAAPPPVLTSEQAKAVEDALTLAQLFQGRGDNTRARREYRRVLDIDPSHGEARQGLAEVEKALRAKR